MEQNALARAILTEYRLHPGLELVDLAKLLYQCVFGCGHIVSDPRACLDRLRTETAAVRGTPGEHGFQPLAGGFARLHLRGLEQDGLTPETVSAMFMQSASGHTLRNTAAFLESLDLLHACCADGVLPFSPGDVDLLRQRCIESDFAPLRHSERYRTLYRPAYRLLRLCYCRFLPLFTAVDRLLARQPRVILAIDGCAGAGKSTLAQLLAGVYDANIFYADDYFLRPEQRTAVRLAEPGGNLDRERFAGEVLAGLASGGTFFCRRFDCATSRLLAPVCRQPKPLEIVEGCYSTHPLFGSPYDLTVFLAVSPELQRRRLSARSDPDLFLRFVQEWIPMERHYFETFEIRQRCTLAFNTDDAGWQDALC